MELSKLAVAAAEAELRETRLLAPFDGTVLMRNYHPGEMVPGSVDCLLLADTSTLKVRATVDEIDIGAVDVGQPVRVVLDAYPTEPLTGTV